MMTRKKRFISYIFKYILGNIFNLPLVAICYYLAFFGMPAPGILSTSVFIITIAIMLFVILFLQDMVAVFWSNLLKSKNYYFLLWLIKSMLVAFKFLLVFFILQYSGFKLQDLFDKIAVASLASAGVMIVGQTFIIIGCKIGCSSYYDYVNERITFKHYFRKG